MKKNDQPAVRWMLGFFVHNGEGDKHEPNFPTFDFWQPDRDTCEAEGRRILLELRNRGDERNWIAYGHPDPYEVGAGRHPGGQWMQRLRDLP